jgi:integrase
MGKLTPDHVMRLPDGVHADGDGLFLEVRGNSRSWMFRYSLNGKNRYLSIGPARAVTLKDARLEAGVLRAHVEDVRKGRRGAVDPAIERQQAREAAKAAKKAAINNKTFTQAAKAYLEAHGTKWTNRKHAWQWEQTLERAYEAFGDVPASDVTRAHVLEVLRPIWRTIPETARRLRGRIETVLDFAEANEWRREANPARYKPIHMSLGDQNAVVTPRPALPFARMPEFMVELRSRDTRAARALELQVLCATRGGEAVRAEWREIERNDDWTIGSWTIPKERVGRKGRKGERHAHVVPLPPAALALLRNLYERRSSDAIFGVTVEAVEKLIKTMNAGRTKAGLPLYLDPKLDDKPVVPHGFRSSFRDWAGDVTNWDTETIEFALAHGITEKTMAAYRRSTSPEKRGILMAMWADHCAGLPVEDRWPDYVKVKRRNNVVPMPQRA